MLRFAILLLNFPLDFQDRCPKQLRETPDENYSSKREYLSLRPRYLKNREFFPVNTGSTNLREVKNQNPKLVEVTLDKVKAQNNLN
jgi:hypothetical protein